VYKCVMMGIKLNSKYRMFNFITLIIFIVINDVLVNEFIDGD
jgi:hypothetical protein